MNKTKVINKFDFNKLSFDEKCVIIEQLLTNEYFSGQAKINFWTPKDFEGKIGESLPETPPEIKEKEDREFKILIDKLSDKLFTEKEEIEFIEEEKKLPLTRYC